jgi:Asp-tRNA(Asn)/Glu-tRNA(Gln) amidotransferase A subunit family amidase
VSEICDLSAVRLRQMIGRREISPVELLDSCLARIDRLDSGLNALPILDRTRGRIAARAAESEVMAGAQLGPLHGLPIGIKDMHDTAGMRSTWGSPLFQDHVPSRDDGMVASVRAGGAIVLAKTNVAEFGAGANTVNRVFGATRNPFDSRLSCAGSSGGSAVALATGMLPVATGSDLGGSLRTPAAFCGVVGFRPTAGMVPDERRAFGWNPLPVLGPMARTVGDAILLYDVMRRVDLDDPLSSPATTIAAAAFPMIDPASLRIAVSADLGFAPVASVVRETFAARIAKLTPMFAVVDYADPPIADADEAFDVMRALAFVQAHGDNFRKRRHMLGDLVAANVEIGLALDVERIARAMALHTRVHRAFAAFMGGWDLLITPTAAVPPFPLEDGHVAAIDGEAMPNYYRWLALTYAITVTGHPALSLPLGRFADGLPFGIQIVGRRGADAFVLRAAEAIEAAVAGDSELARPVPAFDLVTA